MRISMQILTDRLRQNYPDCQMGSMSEEMNLKRPLFYQNGTDFKKNKVYSHKGNPHMADNPRVAKTQFP